METEMIFERFWNRFSSENPHAKRIYDLFTARGGKVVHDHIALRTFDDPRMNIDVISGLFTENGYEAGGNYEFKAKKLRGMHFEHKSDPKAPKVFISELLEKSATITEIQPVEFTEGVHEIPSCFYEFTLR